MNLKQKLDYHYHAFDRSTISPDPLQFLHLFSERDNIELTGFLASVFAYGNVKQIVTSLEEVMRITGGDPYNYITHYNRQHSLSFKHRFYTSDDIKILFLTLEQIYKEYGSIENVFMKHYESSAVNIRNSLSVFTKLLLKIADKKSKPTELSKGVRFMFPDPESGSACKRLNLFLRWMVRKDELDFGIWKGVRTDQLIIPVDTHIAGIAKDLKLTSKKNISWNMAEEITNNLKKFDPDDPVKYDFALCHIGMRKLNL